MSHFPELFVCELRGVNQKGGLSTELPVAAL